MIKLKKLWLKSLLGLLSLLITVPEASALTAPASPTPSSSPSPTPTPILSDPQTGPLQERTLLLDQQSFWTLRTEEQDVPLAVVPDNGLTVLSLTGGWLILKADLSFSPESLAWLPTTDLQNREPAMLTGTPNAVSAGQGVVFLTADKMGLLYPREGTVFWTQAPPLSPDSLSVNKNGFAATSGRRLFIKKTWNQEWNEAEPLPFFPSNFTASPAGQPWACDSLQALPWTRRQEFWNPLPAPQAPGRMTELLPFSDDQGYFACGPGWVGGFSTEGTLLWSRFTTLNGQELPQDLRMAVGNNRLYLWSALARTVWVWSWDSQESAGSTLVPPVSWQELIDAPRQLAQTWASQGAYPEAGLLQAGAELLYKAQLQSEPFSTVWSRFTDDARSAKAAYFNTALGNGSFTLDWSEPNGLPLADWSWLPDAGTAPSRAWKVESQTFWEGQPGKKRLLTIAQKASKSPWPGAEHYQYGPLQLPSWLNITVYPLKVRKVPSQKDSLGWVRIPLPVPPQPYNLPTE